MEKVGQKPINPTGCVGIPMRFRQLPTGCWICVSHRPNKDGYMRLRFDKLRMMHRAVFEMRGIVIPDGYDVDHICHNRGCCNVDHLRIIDGAEHAVISNRDRYSRRRISAKRRWIKGATIKEMAAEFGVSISAVQDWIRQFKQESRRCH